MNIRLKKFRIVGRRRDHIDVTRFAEALVALALHRVDADATEADQSNDPDTELQQEAA